MAILNILTDEDETLRKTCRPNGAVTERTKRLLDDMYETMKLVDGVGLAGPQVGVLRRIAVVDIGEKRYDLVDPVIVQAEGSQVGREGCLSLPDQCGIVERPMKVTVRATGRDGKEYTVTGEGLLARAFCHEIDHLDGILYTDKAQRMLTPEEMEQSE